MVEKCPTCAEECKNRRSVLAHHHYHHPDQLEDRFWFDVDKGEKDECWKWTGALESTGYGQFKRDGKRYQSNRYSWMIHNGEIGDNLVLHTCDNRACVNPNHLYLGDYSDNMNDMWERDRHSIPESPEPPGFKGEDHPGSKLSEREVREILNRGHDESYSDVASDYDVQKSLIQQIMNGDIWTHVDEGIRDV
jgi:hypothetical protein